MTMKRAYSVLEIKAVDDGEGVITGIATTPSTDRMGDIVEPEGAQFKLPIPLLWQHDSRQPIGMVERAKVTPAGIEVVARIARGVSTRIDEAWTLIKSGLVRGLSIGFNAIESADIKGTLGVHFIKWEWLELSAVTIPANSDASIASVKHFDAAHRPRPAAAGVVHLAPGASGSAEPNRKGTGMKTLAEQIAAFEAKRAAAVARQTEIMSESAEEGRTLDATEAQEYDELATEVRGVDEHLVRLRAHQKNVQASATPVPGAPQPGENRADDADGARARDAGRPYMSVRSNEPKGHAFTKYAMLLVAAKGNLTQAVEMARVHCKDDPRIETVLKAAVTAGSTSDATWAGPLLPYNDMASEFIELLRPMTILGLMSGSMRRVPFNVRMPRQTAGATAGWVGQGSPKPASSLTFDTVSLPWSKIAVIIALTEELVRFSSPSAVAVCQQDMVDTIAQYMNEQFISPSVAVSSGVRPASVLNGVTATPSTGSTVAAIMTDVSTLVNRFLSANATPRRGYWVMNPRTALYLSLLRTAQDVFAFPNITMDGGTWMGFPVITSQSVSLDYGSPSATYIALVDAADILYADDGQVTLDVSREASLQMDSAPSAGAQSLVSLWQNNLVGLRAERYVHWLKRRSTAAYFIDGVTY